MSRTRHPRKVSRSRSDHLRKDKEWKRDSTWKPAERKVADPGVRSSQRIPRRSKRRRTADQGGT